MSKSTIAIIVFIFLSSCDSMIKYTFIATNKTNNEIVFYRSHSALDSGTIRTVKLDTIRIMPNQTKIISQTDRIARPKDNFFTVFNYLLPDITLKQKDRATIKNLGDTAIWNVRWPEADSGCYYLVVDSTFF